MMSSSEQEKLCMVEDTSRASALSANATVSCSRCGVRAHDPSSVCDPVPLASSSEPRD